MNINLIPLDFKDKLSIVGERLNDYIARDMGHNIYSMITDIIAPLSFDYRDIENIIKDKLKSFDNYSLRSYTSDKIENAWYNESIIPQSIKDEFLNLDNDFVKNIIDGEEWNWRSDIHSSKDGTLLERTITVTLPSGQTTSLTRYQSIDNKSGQAQDD